MKNKILSRILGSILTGYLLFVVITTYNTGQDWRPYIDDLLRV